MKDSKVILTDIDLQGRVLPQAIDFEEAVLGAMMMEQNATEAVINDLKSEMFYKEANQIIYESILSVFRRNEPVDLLSVSKQLYSIEKMDVIGGAYYLSSLTNHIVSSANIEYHARIIREKYIQRKIISLNSELINLSFDVTVDFEDLISRQNRIIDTINDLFAGKLAIQTIGEVADECLLDLITRCDNHSQGILNGIPTGSKALDKLTGGWKEGLIIIAGRPGMKKTALALMSAFAAAESGFYPAFFSLEMTNTSLVDRILLAESGLYIDSVRYANGDLMAHEKQAIIDASIRLRDLNFHLDPNPIVNMYYLGSTLRRLVAKGKCSIAFVDYLQLVESEKEKGKNREREVAEITRYLKLLSKELHIPIILLAQLSRKVEDRISGQGRPQLSDLRESGAIEQDADMVILTWIPEKYGVKYDSNNMSMENILFALIEKHRNGSIGEIMLKSYPSPYKIVDVDYYQEQSINRTPIDRYEKQDYSPF